MTPEKPGYRVAVVGASSLLGKELVAVLEQGKFPVSRLVTFDGDEDEPELPILDLGEGSAGTVQDDQVKAEELDFAFLAAPLREPPAFLNSWSAQEKGCVVIDIAGEGLAPDARTQIGTTSPESPISIPFLDRRFPVPATHTDAARLLVSPHPAVIVISSILQRLGARFSTKFAVAQVFSSAAEFGSRGVEELQRQTVNILSFQNIPNQIFGAQLAFNLLSRLGSSGKGDLPALENRLQRQLRSYLDGRLPMPALHVIQAPVFYSLAVSLYVETAEPLSTEAATAALAGERIKVRKPVHDAPTPVEVTGSSDILVDRISLDAGRPNGLWIWAVADNLHLAATNAVELAASFREPARA